MEAQLPQAINWLLSCQPKLSSYRALGTKVGYMLLVAGALVVVFDRWAFDDPFITYRYAYNLDHGIGLVYNPGERVMSTTTPLFALLLAVLGNLWSDLPRVANIVGAMSIAWGALFLWDLGHSWKIPLVGWTALFLYPTFPISLGTLGSEMPMYLAFCLGAFACYARGRYRGAALCAGLAILTRPDGVLVAVILLAHYLARKPGPGLRAPAVIFLCLTVPWFLFSWIYFGSPVPATLAAKQHQGAMLISQTFAPGLLDIVSSFVMQTQYAAELALALLGLVYAFLRARQVVFFLLWPIVYAIAYSALGVSRYMWYYAPLVPGLIVAVGMGIACLANWGQVAATHPCKFGKRLQILCADVHAVVRGGVFGLGVVIAVVQAYGAWDLAQAPDPRIPIYQAAGDWVRANTPPEASVGGLEVGALGYYAHRRMIDFAGLIEPEVSAQFTSHWTYDDAALWATERYHPDYIVIPDDGVPHFEEEYVWQHCWPVQAMSGREYRFSRDVTIYSCPQGTGNEHADPRQRLVQLGWRGYNRVYIAIPRA